MAMQEEVIPSVLDQLRHHHGDIAPRVFARRGLNMLEKRAEELSVRRREHYKPGCCAPRERAWSHHEIIPLCPDGVGCFRVVSHDVQHLHIRRDRHCEFDRLSRDAI